MRESSRKGCGAPGDPAAWSEVAERLREHAARRDQAARVLHPEALRLAGRLRGKRALDVGCGTGALVRVLSERGASVVGVDPSPASIEQARRDAEELGLAPVPRFRVGDPARAKSLPRGPFDLVTALLVLDPDEQPRRQLRALARVLRPGGRLVLAFPHPYAAGVRVHGSIQALVRQLRGAGLRIVDIGEPALPDAPETAYLVLLTERLRRRPRRPGSPPS